ncbi:response regulator transcription factor [Streptomyces sp. DR7-3]|uniref:response regulator n=1 Tax=Streptomyces malaysiensis TaxID=92644 RepID=UPI002042BDDE|nr:response regulator transcription factor [Streptomyces sp. DR7-3]MCM3809987.1 response regulator transcription factor [Streptomyces sp. DR7-3]
MSDAPITVVVADDQRVIRDGLVTILGALDGIRVAAAAQDGAEAVALAVEHEADVVLMDLHMPGTDGIEATRRLREQLPSTAVVVLTTYTDDDSILAALEAGAIGYLTKNASAADIHRGIAAAAAGHTILDPAAAARVMRAARRQDAGPGPADTLPDGLTGREAQVLALIAQGLSNAEIAAKLYLSRSTVKTHINQIFAKTGSRDRSQAIVYAHRHALTAPER